MEKKRRNYLKKIFSKFFDDLTFNEWITYYWYNITFRRKKLVEMWKEPNEDESIIYLTKQLQRMENDRN